MRRRTDFEKRGYLTTSADMANRRERLNIFTEEGKRFSNSILSQPHLLEERAMQKLGEERRQQLIECNAKYYRLLRKEMENGSYAG